MGSVLYHNPAAIGLLKKGINMKANHLAVIFPAKDLPQNTVHACGAIWTRTSRMLLPGLGKLYDRFHPAAQPWGVEIPAPFSVVLGRDDPCRFLRLYLRAKIGRAHV